jgi:hypothetical protein
MPQRERRTARRHPLEITIEVSIGRDVFFQATRDVSRTGAFLERAIPYPVGTQARLKLLLPDGGEPITCTGEVASVPDATEVGMGLKFLDISEKDQRRIEILGIGQSSDGETII